MSVESAENPSSMLRLLECDRIRRVMDAKEELLKQAGYGYNFNRLAYINRRAKKIFSVEAIEDHSPEWLSEKLAESSNGEWRFYFNEPPSAAVIRDFLVEFDDQRRAAS